MEAIKVEARFGSKARKSHSEAKQSQSMRSCGSKISRRELSAVCGSRAIEVETKSLTPYLFVLLSIDNMLNSQLVVYIVVHRGRAWQGGRTRAGSPNDDAPFC